MTWPAQAAQARACKLCLPLRLLCASCRALWSATWGATVSAGQQHVRVAVMCRSCTFLHRSVSSENLKAVGDDSAGADHWTTPVDQPPLFCASQLPSAEMPVRLCIIRAGRWCPPVAELPALCIADGAVPVQPPSVPRLQLGAEPAWARGWRRWTWRRPAAARRGKTLQHQGKG